MHFEQQLIKKLHVLVLDCLAMTPRNAILFYLLLFYRKNNQPMNSQNNQDCISNVNNASCRPITDVNGTIRSIVIATLLASVNNMNHVL